MERIKGITQTNAVEKYVLDRFEKELTDAEMEKLNKIIEKNGFANMYKSIVGKARKVAVNNCAAVSEEEVFGWARHWLDETDINNLEKAIENANKREEEPIVKQTKEKKTDKKAADGSEQLTLFNLLEV